MILDLLAILIVFIPYIGGCALALSIIIIIFRKIIEKSLQTNTPKRTLYFLYFLGFGFYGIVSFVLIVFLGFLRIIFGILSLVLSVYAVKKMIWTWSKVILWVVPHILLFIIFVILLYGGVDSLYWNHYIYHIISAIVVAVQIGFLVQASIVFRKHKLIEQSHKTNFDRTSQTIPQTPVSIKCPRCGTGQSGVFCNNCGFQLSPPNAQPGPTTFQQISSPSVNKNLSPEDELTQIDNKFEKFQFELDKSHSSSPSRPPSKDKWYTNPVLYGGLIVILTLLIWILFIIPELFSYPLSIFDLLWPAMSLGVIVIAFILGTNGVKIGNRLSGFCVICFSCILILVFGGILILYFGIFFLCWGC